MFPIPSQINPREYKSVHSRINWYEHILKMNKNRIPEKESIVELKVKWRQNKRGKQMERTDYTVGTKTI
jgi:hypothetical protein